MNMIFQCSGVMPESSDLARSSAPPAVAEALMTV
jgi:hypothetical protein